MLSPLTKQWYYCFIVPEEQPVVRDVFQEESDSIPEYTAEEEREDNRLWRTVVIGDQEQRIDMKAIEPYKKVISHGGRETCKLFFLNWMEQKHNFKIEEIYFV